MTDRLSEELHRIACHLDLVARHRGLKRLAASLYEI